MPSPPVTRRDLPVTLTALVLAVLVLAAATVAAHAAPPDSHTRLDQPAYVPVPAGDGPSTRAAYGGLVTVNAQVEPPADAPSRDNWANVTYNHFGNPAAGMAVLETWIRVTYDDGGLPITNQGGCRGIRLRSVTRIAVRCILHTRGGTSNDDATGPTVNSGDVGNPVIVSTASPTISAGYNPGTNTTQFCRSWTEIRYAIRWDDNTLSSGKVLVAPSTLFNRRCDFLGGP